jgi:penicillin-binding protein 1A
MSGKSYGPTSLTNGLAYSRNLITMRLAMKIGLKKIAETAEKFGIYDKMPLRPSMVLGAGETNLLKMTVAYASIINNGKKISPKFYKTITNRHAENIFQADYGISIVESNCTGNYIDVKKKPVFEVVDRRPCIADPKAINDLKQMLKDVISHGTGKKLLYLTDKYNIDLLGKTGTTNKAKDAWFIGAITNIKNKIWTDRQIVVGIFIGHHRPQSLGEKASGASIAVPIFEDFVNRIFVSNL